MRDPRTQDTAVLITCHNRRETTLRCLRALTEQRLPVGHTLRVILTDDGSTDGTGDAVRREFPATTVLQGDGNLFWVGGTLLAWQAARPADFYLWLNDDVELRPDALRTLFDVHQSAGDPAAIVVGATCDPETGKTGTGGMRRRGWYNVSIMVPSGRVEMCDSMNGNIVLVPRVVEQRIGCLDSSYTHFFADGDYGIRARKHGIPVLLAPAHLGECRLNPLTDTSFDTSLTTKQRWQKMCGPKGYRRPREWWAFVRSHAPRPKVFFWAAPYVLFGLECLVGGKLKLRAGMRPE